MTLQKEHSRLGHKSNVSMHEHGLFRNRQATGGGGGGAADNRLEGTDLEREAAHTHHTAISGHRETLRFLLLQCKLIEDFESKDITL